MEFFDIDENTMINIDNIDSVRIENIGKEKIIIIYIKGQSFKLKQDKKAHQEFFTALIKKGARPNKQFVSL